MTTNPGSWAREAVIDTSPEHVLQLEQRVADLLAALEGMLNAFLLAATNPDQRTAIENGENAIAAHQGEGT